MQSFLKLLPQKTRERENQKKLYLGKRYYSRFCDYSVDDVAWDPQGGSCF